MLADTQESPKVSLRGDRRVRWLIVCGRLCCGHSAEQDEVRAATARIRARRGTTYSIA